MKILKKEDVDYPQMLLKIKNPPEKLYVEGDYTLLNKNSIAIVGSRKCTPYGWRQAKRISNDLAKSNICVISGMAMGIDTAAHLGAINEIGKTVAVLGGGFNDIFPKQNIQLYEEILKQGGCVVSEYEPNEPVDLSKFPQRNRIISGIALGVLVVEAKYRSGSNITARNAIKEKKPVFCVPSNLENTNGYGPNKLIQEGASLIMSAQDILQELELLTETNQEVVQEQYKEVYELIGNIPTSANDICRLTQKTISEINEILLMLELQGLIKSFSGNQFVKK